MNNGVSKKLCGTIAGIAAIAPLAKENPMAGMIVIGVIVVIHELIQGWLDHRKGLNEAIQKHFAKEAKTTSDWRSTSVVGPGVLDKAVT